MSARQPCGLKECEAGKCRIVEVTVGQKASSTLMTTCRRLFIIPVVDDPMEMVVSLAITHR